MGLTVRSNASSRHEGALRRRFVGGVRTTHPAATPNETSDAETAKWLSVARGPPTGGRGDKSSLLRSLPPPPPTRSTCGH